MENSVIANFVSSFASFYDAGNSQNQALIPEQWAQEALMLLEANLIMGSAVNRDYNEKVASFGETIHIHKPNRFVAARKGPNDPVVDQVASSTDVKVTLDQHIHVSFLLNDVDMSKSFIELVSYYLKPALMAQTEFLDRSIYGACQKVALTNRVGVLGGGADYDTILDAGLYFDTNLVPADNRWMIINPLMQRQFKSQNIFYEAQVVGDDGTALRAASLGKVNNFNFIQTQTAPNIPVTKMTDNSKTDIDGATSAGATVINVTSGTNAAAGKFITIAGAGGPYVIVSVSTNALTITPALEKDVPDAAAVVIYADAANHLVNQASTSTTNGGDGTNAGYRQGWDKAIAWDTGGSTPNVGQMVTFGTANPGTTPLYQIIQVGSGTITLDRPLEAAVADNAAIYLGPVGHSGLVLRPDAVTLVTRPLQAPLAGTGAQSYVANYNGFSVRATISYDSQYQRHRVVIDCLFGIAITDAAQLAVVFS